MPLKSVTFELYTNIRVSVHSCFYVTKIIMEIFQSLMYVLVIPIMLKFQP